MRQNTVKTSPVIRWISGIMIFLGAGFLVASFFVFILLPMALIVALSCLICFLWTPRTFEISDDFMFTVHYRLGSRQFGPVLKCSRITERIGGIRLCGNGGLFSLTGWFWAKKYGRFRMYSTSANYRDLVLLETDRCKIMISPENPNAWLSDCALRKLPIE